MKDLLKDKAHLEAGKRDSWGEGQPCREGGERHGSAHTAETEESCCGPACVCYRGKGRGWERCRGTV